MKVLKGLTEVAYLKSQKVKGDSVSKPKSLSLGLSGGEIRKETFSSFKHPVLWIIHVL